MTVCVLNVSGPMKVPDPLEQDQGVFVRRLRRHHLIAASAAAVALVGAGAVASQSSHNPSSSFYAGEEPDRSISPGLADPSSTLHVVCTQSTAERRNVSEATKRKVYEEYGVSYPQPPGKYEVDHIIPLTIGGSNDIRNLFLQPASPKPGFHEKDALEVRLHTLVCSPDNPLPLKQAQKEIATDWVAAYNKYVLKK